MDRVKETIEKEYERLYNHRKKLPSSMNGRPLKKADMHVHTSFSREIIPGGINRHHGYEKITNFALRLLFAYRKAFYSKNFYGKPLEIPDLKNYSLYFHLPYSPKEVFDDAMKSGMDFVPITDHNTIDGALWLLKKYPSLSKRVIVGEEVSSSLETKYDVDVGVYDINKIHHEEIQAKRANARKLVAYLKKNRILFSLNHITGYIWGHLRPIRKNEIKACIDLFDIFEVRNGMLNELNNKVTEILAKISNKGAIGGTDSHSLRIGKTYTAAYANTKEEFLEQIRKKQSYVFGEHGGPGVMRQEIFDKFSNYKNILINGKKLFPEGSRFHDFVFNRLASRISKKSNNFVGANIERENIRIVFDFIKKSGSV